MKTMVHSFYGDTDFFDIVTRLVRTCPHTIFVYTLPRLCTLNVSRSNKKENGFRFKKKKKARFR